MQRQAFVQHHVDGSDEYAQVTAIAEALFAHLSAAPVAQLIHDANQPGLSSAGIQGASWSTRASSGSAMSREGCSAST